MKILITNNNTNDCIEFATFDDIERILSQLSEAKNMLQDMLTAGNSIVIQGDK